MIRHVITTLVVASALAAQAAPYISLSGGGSFLAVEDRSAQSTDHLDEGFVGEAAVGLAYCPIECDTSVLRGEIAYAFQNAKAEMAGDDDVDITTIMFNGYLDLCNDSSIDPYLMFGVGRADIESGPYDRSELAYQIGGGIGYSMSEHIILDLKYRYLNLEDDTNDLRFHLQQVLLGVRYMF